MLSITFKTNVLSFFFLSANEDTSRFPRPSPLSPPVALFIFFLSPSGSVWAAPHHPPPPPPHPATSHSCPVSPPSLPYLTLSLSLYHFLTRLPHLSLSQPHLLDIPALFSCSLQHNFLTHFLSPPWPPDQSLQDGIALGSGEGEREMVG